MRSGRAVLVVPFALLLFLVPSASAVQVVLDGSFEAGASGDSPNWEEGSTIFGTPLCTVAVCGDGGGTAGPRTGSVWAWFGGFAGTENAFLSQAFVIPPGKATLTFYVWIGAGSGNGTDFVRVLMDGTELFKVLENASGYSSYNVVTLDVSKYANGGSHTLRFEGAFTAGSNINVDDVALDSVPVPCGGKTATMVGTEGTDSIAGTGGNDVIAVLSGNDSVNAGAGNDTVCGGTGNDNMNGSGGKDKLLGEAGNDKLKGGSSNDKLKGGSGQDACSGGSGTDKAGCEKEKSVP